MSSYRYDIAFSTPVPVPTQELHTIIGKYLQGYSLLVGEGAWQGTVEHAYTVSVASDRAVDSVVTDLAEALRDTYEQQCVLVTSWQVDIEFI